MSFSVSIKLRNSRNIQDTKMLTLITNFSLGITEVMQKAVYDGMRSCIVFLVVDFNIIFKFKRHPVLDATGAPEAFSLIVGVLMTEVIDRSPQMSRNVCSQPPFKCYGTNETHS